jgi:hypothetical protein
LSHTLFVQTITSTSTYYVQEAKPVHAYQHATAARKVTFFSFGKKLPFQKKNNKTVDAAGLVVVHAPTYVHETETDLSTAN